jgi:polysaccharide biosynthesis/export protein
MNRKFPVYAVMMCSLLAPSMFAQTPAQNAVPPKSANAANVSTTPANNPKTDPKSDSYVIGNGDELLINVWKEPELTRTVPVRPDGKITLPLVGEVQASGLTPRQLEADLSKQLVSYVTAPSVTVAVQSVRSQKFNIVGEVAKPGSYELVGPPSTVLDAIAMAGGLKDFAKSKKIYILRLNSNGTQVRLPFNYAQVVKGENMEQNVVLQSRDTIVVP